jgi:broad specificity phosphatase PhoE
MPTIHRVHSSPRPRLGDGVRAGQSCGLVCPSESGVLTPSVPGGRIALDTASMARTSGARLLLVRSGATAWDLAGRVQGATDLPISAEGCRDVARFVETLRSGPTPARLQIVHCAPDEASRATAGLLARATRARVEVVSEFAELGLGLWEGLSREELGVRCKAGRQWVEAGESVVAPEGERSLNEFLAERVVPAYERIVGERRRRGYAIVLRPIALGSLRCHLHGVPLAEFWTMIESAPATEWYDLTPVATHLAKRSGTAQHHPQVSGSAGEMPRFGVRTA